MKRISFIVVLSVVVIAVAAFYARSGDGAPAQAATKAGAPGARPPMTVDLVTPKRAAIEEHLTVVGNLIGAATVEVVPKVNGRLESVNVRLGDAVQRGQMIAKIEDREIREQVKQVEASAEVATATIRQREADLKLAQTNFERSKSLFSRELLPKQTMDDVEARQDAAAAQLDLARAQYQQAKSRLDELRMTLNNTVIPSPVNGFVGKRYLDAGAWVSNNAPVASVVDISLVRMVANLVEKDLRRVIQGVSASVEVDAYPGEHFKGRVARVSPVLDPLTRTAEMEIEIPNPNSRLKPGMYARVQLTTAREEKALVVPRQSLVVVDGKPGVFLAAGTTATFRAVTTGLEDKDSVEIRSGLTDGDRIVTTGAAGLHDGDRVIIAGQQGPGRGERAGGAGPSPQPK